VGLPCSDLELDRLIRRSRTRGVGGALAGRRRRIARVLRPLGVACEEPDARLRPAVSGAARDIRGTAIPAYSISDPDEQ